MNNITIKNVANVDTVYVAKRPSNGAEAAVWMCDAAADISAYRPSLTMVARKSQGPKKAQKVSSRYNYPVRAVVDGVSILLGTIPIEISATIAADLSDSVIAEAVTQCMRLHNNADVIASFVSGYAPRS